MTAQRTPVLMSDGSLREITEPVVGRRSSLSSVGSGFLFIAQLAKFALQFHSLSVKITSYPWRNFLASFCPRVGHHLRRPPITTIECGFSTFFNVSISSRQRYS